MPVGSAHFLNEPIGFGGEQEEGNALSKELDKTLGICFLRFTSEKLRMSAPF